jgi:hypothetical protein
LVALITVKLYRSRGDTVVAACDKDLLGKVFFEGDLKLDVHPDFYEGEDADAETLLNRLGMATIANLVGEEVCRIAADNGYIDMDGVMRIGGVPHAQMVRC